MKPRQLPQRTRQLSGAPETDEIVYVPGPLQEAPPRGRLLRMVQEQVSEARAEAVPRGAMDDVALAKQALLDAAHAKPRRHERSRHIILGQPPLRLAAAAVVLAAVVTFVPPARLAAKAGMILALRAGFSRMISRYF